MVRTRGASRERAVQLASEGKLEEALAEYQGVAKTAPDDAEVRQKVAELHEWLGHPAEASTAYEGAALAWMKADQPLRAVAACVALSRLGTPPATRARTARLLAERFALAPGASPTPALQGTAGPVPPQDAPGALPIFSWLDPDAFVALLEALEMRAFFPGQVVVEEGTPGASMFAMVEGRADVVRTLEGGERRSVATVGPGDFFGELALVSEGLRLATVTVTERSVLLELTRERLGAAAAKHPQVAGAVDAFYRRRMVENLLRSNPLLSKLTPEQKAAVSRDFQLRTVTKNEALLKQGQPGDAFYVVLRGRCTPWLEQPNGRRVALAELREGDVFGEISLLLDKPVSATVRADVDGVVLRLERAAFEKHLLSQPGLKGMLMRMGTERLQRTAQVLASGRVLHDGDLRV
ncbi:cyclic nucleotide-binding domain-containing protein [Pyxidicoccus fallax]|uniref:Cyclic nucleotide-binding domain-containing protein n=1 Tax=Pyxidicoccus fallax TaxID=394095 RepID=A0A848LWI2_9BACT|nr:cyclic nucleotide-binding domain-containing protein [Pyxidicoccus fallax]NMO22156.1 cyclic nucleotide-binding domain-containing protein [Pyxidicoccus fallax]NPC83549.1 cyclic nucleotide-binding domain-containing protein [Pyxidicoccus fallax]